MPRQIDDLRTALERAHPGLTIRREAPGDPAEGDGTWHVSHPDALAEVQIETETGDAPFLVGSDFAPPMPATSLDEAIRLVRERLGLLVGGA